MDHDIRPIDHRSVILKIQDLTAPGWIPLIARARLTTLMLHAVRLPEDINNLIVFRNSDAGRASFEACRAASIRIEYQMHTASWLIPRSYFWDRPDMFRMDAEGQRTSDFNFCLSSDPAHELLEAQARRLVTELPSDTGRYFLCADDVRSAWCHCPACAPFSAPDQNMIFANRMLAAIRRVHPDARLSYLAYQDSLAPPERVRPDEGIFLEFAPIGRCYRHALDDPACAINRTHLRSLESLRAYFGGAPFHVTEYWLDASRHSAWRRPAKQLPVPMDVVRRDVGFYRRQGACSIATYAVMCDEEYWASFGEPPVAEYGEIVRNAR